MKNLFNPSDVGLLTLTAVVGILLSGCSSCKPGKPGPSLAYNIEVKLDQTLKGKSVLVDLVGVNPASLPRWEAYSMSSYWKGGDPMRGDSAPDRVSFNFVSGESLAQTLSVTNAQWRAWKAKGVAYVEVLADLPGGHTDKPADSDDRRLKLPLDECHWVKGTKTLNVLVQQSGIQVLAPTR